MVTVARGDDKEVKLRGIISVVEFIEVSPGDFSDFISATVLKSDATDFRKAVQVRVKLGEAKIRETLILNTRSGQRGKSKSVHEISYPEHFFPPLRAPEKAGSDNKEKEIQAVPPAPMKFRTRELGGVLEVAPVFNNDGTITVNVHPALSVQLERKVQADGESSGGETPIFHYAEVSEKVVLKNGGYAFLGTGRLPDERGSKDFEDPILLIFLRADSF